MKAKIFFTVQVFAVLVLFLSIFVTSLLRERDRQQNAHEATVVVESNEEETKSSPSTMFVSFAQVFSQISGY